MSTRTRRPSVTAYYLGRPAALWQTALAPRRTAGQPPRDSFAGQNRGPAAK
jgi:hypothetical protein